MTFLEYLASPGFGGLGAIVAAVVVGVSAILVSWQRRDEAEQAAAAAARTGALERWWTQYAWLVSTEADRLPFEGRVEILVHLIRRAEQLVAPELTATARVYAGVLRHWIDERAGDQHVMAARWQSSVEQEVASFSPGRRAAAAASLPPLLSSDVR